MKGGLGTASQKGLCLFDYMKNNEKRVKLKKELVTDPTYREFLQRIEKIRESKNLTQCEFAKQLGISQVQVSRIEKKVLQSMKKAMQ